MSDLARKEISMLRHVIFGLAAATLVGTMVAPGDALAHRRAGPHGINVCGEASHRGWNPFTRNPGQAGHPGPHDGCDCYRAASGRAMCRFM
jgi:hypothetical protein